MGEEKVIGLVLLSLLIGCAGALAGQSPRLAAVLGMDQDSHSLRVEAAKALGTSLASDEIMMLYSFLDRKASSEDPGKPGELNALKNEVVNTLKMQANLPPELANRLMSMYGNRSHDEVWRDYCIQHLGDIFLSIQDEDCMVKARGILWLAVNEKHSSISGTGLIALFNLCGQKGFEKDRISAKALEMVRSLAYGEPAKMTALQICAKLGLLAVLPDARKLALGESIPIRMSAMACLGVLGDKADLELLNMAERSTDIRLKTAATAAISRLKAKRACE